MPPATARLWQRLNEAPALGGFYLLGGTALALNIHHRQSEDLDFAWPGVRLPRTKLNALVRMLETEAWSLERDDSAESYDEFQIAGMDLHDYQQDFIAHDGAEGIVKLNFFVPSGPLERLLPPTGEKSVMVPGLPLLFKTKCLVTSERSASRDWLDLYLLMTRHGFSIEDYVATFEELDDRRNLDVGLDRLCSGKPRATDPGYQTLLPDAPTEEEITGFFRTEIRRWKRSVAQERLGRSADDQEK